MKSNSKGNSLELLNILLMQTTYMIEFFLLIHRLKPNLHSLEQAASGIGFYVNSTKTNIDVFLNNLEPSLH